MIGPALAAVGRLVEELAADVDRARVEGVVGEAGVPVEAQLRAVRRLDRVHRPPLAGLHVVARDLGKRSGVAKA